MTALDLTGQFTRSAGGEGPYYSACQSALAASALAGRELKRSRCGSQSPSCYVPFTGHVAPLPGWAHFVIGVVVGVAVTAVVVAICGTGIGCAVLAGAAGGAATYLGYTRKKDWNTKDFVEPVAADAASGGAAKGAQIIQRVVQYMR